MLRWNLACLLRCALGNNLCKKDKWEARLGTGRSWTAVWPTQPPSPTWRALELTQPLWIVSRWAETTRPLYDQTDWSLNVGHPRKGLGLGCGSSLPPRQSLKDLPAECCCLAEHRQQLWLHVLRERGIWEVLAHTMSTTESKRYNPFPGCLYKCRDMKPQKALPSCGLSTAAMWLFSLLGFTYKPLIFHLLVSL